MDRFYPFGILFLFCGILIPYVYGQSTLDILRLTLETAIDKIEETRLDVQGIKETLTSLQEKQDETRLDVQGIKETLTSLQEKIDEGDRQRDATCKTCSSRDQVINLQESFSTELERIQDSIQRCSSSEQLSNLKALFTTDECAGSHNCSPNASCENTLTGYQCDCGPGYAGDGVTCEDLDECLTEGSTTCHSKASCINTIGSYNCVCSSGYSGDGVTACVDLDECLTEGSTTCHSKATCINTIGSYNCVCSSGYSGDGVTACETCDSPSKNIEGLGCVTLVKEKLIWQEAKENCKSQLQSRLLEGITTQQELQLLTEHFLGDSKKYEWVHLGFYDLKWLEGGNRVPSTLFDSGEPTQGTERCGHLYLSTSAIHDINCSVRLPSLCQKVPI